MRTAPEVYPTRSTPKRRCGAMNWRPSRLGPRPALPRPGAPGHLRQPALGRGNRAPPLRPRPGRRHRPSARRLRRTVHRGTHARPTEVEGRPPHRRHPVLDPPRPRRPSGRAPRPEADALIFPGVKGGPLRRSNFNKMAAWPHAVPAIGAAGLHFPRSPAHREHLRGRQRREPERSDGPDGPRQRARRDHLPARGPRADLARPRRPTP